MREKIKYIILSFIMIVAFAATGFATFTILDDESISQNENGNFDDEKINVKVGYISYVGLEEEVTNVGYLSGDDNTFVDISETTDGYNKSSKFDHLNDLLDEYTNQNYRSLEVNLTQTANETNELASGSYRIPTKTSDESFNYLILVVDEKISVNSTCSVESGCGGTTQTFKYTFSGTYRLYKAKINQKYITETTPSPEFIYETEIAKNSLFPVDDFLKFSFENSSDYILSGFYLSNSDFKEKYGSFNPDNKISEDTYLIAVFFKDDISENKIDLTDLVNYNHNNLKIYKGSSFDPSNDFSYFEASNSFSLGKYGSKTTINADSVINFCTNDGYVYSLNNVTACNSVEPNSSAQRYDYKIVLQNDLNIYGTLTIGSKFAGTNNQGINGAINGAYIQLDLNGYDINIFEGGELISYGLISDSKGDGTINNRGGKLSTLMAIYDYKGGGSTAQQVLTNKNFPFTYYLLPYLRCKVNVYFAANFNSSFTAIATLKPSADSDISPLEVNFIGAEENVFFKITEKNENSCISLNTFLLDVEETKNLDEFKKNFANDYKYCSLYRNQRSFNNVGIKISSIKLSISVTLPVIGPIDADVNTEEFNFPITSLFDIYFYNSKLDFSQSLQFLPGSYFYADEKSQLIFNYTGSNSAKIYFLGDNLNHYDKGKKSFLVRKDSTVIDNGDICASPITSSQLLWKYRGKAKADCKGQVIFNQGNANNEYVLMGNINIDKIGYRSSESSANSTIVEFDGVLSLDELSKNSVFIKTFGFDYIPGYDKFIGSGGTLQQIRTYTLPLISNQKAYVYSNNGENYSIEGDYVDEGGLILDSNNKMYYFNIDSKSYDAKSRQVSVKECAYNEKTHIITDIGSKSKFVYFAECFFEITGESTDKISINVKRVTTENSGSCDLKFDSENNCWLRA